MVSRVLRLKLVALSVVVGLAVCEVLVLVPVASGGNATCQIADTSVSGSSYSDLQTAVNNAISGDTLVIRGTCVGTTTIGINLTLTGKGNAPTLDGQHGGAVISIPFVMPIPTVAITSLTITGGSLGGIDNYNYGATVILSKSTITGNTDAGGGGGIFSDGTVTLNDSTVSNNAAFNSFGSTDGGGIINLGGTVTLNGHSSVTGNSSNALDGDQYGGGISNDGTLILNDQSSVSGNTAGKGGCGIENFGTVTLNNQSSVSQNTGCYAGGGIDNGYFFGSGGTVTLNDHSSITGNTASEAGGGIADELGTVNMNGHSTISGNTVTDTTSGHGGGIWANGGTLNGAIAGTNVYDNNPDNIFTLP